MNRIDKINKIIELRDDWTFIDYKEAYSDVWEYIPNNINQCKAMMEEYISNTYDNNLLDEILEAHCI